MVWSALAALLLVTTAVPARAATPARPVPGVGPTPAGTGGPGTCWDWLGNQGQERSLTVTSMPGGRARIAWPFVGDSRVLEFRLFVSSPLMAAAPGGGWTRVAAPRGCALRTVTTTVSGQRAGLTYTCVLVARMSRDDGSGGFRWPQVGTCRDWIAR